MVLHILVLERMAYVVHTRNYLSRLQRTKLYWSESFDFLLVATALLVEQNKCSNRSHVPKTRNKEIK